MLRLRHAARQKRNDIGSSRPEILPFRDLAGSKGKIDRAQIIVLKPYEEGVGPLYRLEERNDVLLAEIGKIVVALPIWLKDVLSPNLNRRIAILRTDIPGKQYLFRVLPEERPDHEMESAALAVQAIATETNARQCKMEGILR